MRNLLLLFLLVSTIADAQMSAILGSNPARKLAIPPVGTDTVPNSISFTDEANREPSTQYTSNGVTLSGLTSTTHIRVIGGTYSINGGSYVSTTGIVSNGDIIRARVTTSSAFFTPINAIVTIGGVSDTYTVSTLSLALAYDSLKSYFTEGYFAKDGKTNTAGTIQATHGQDVLAIKETIVNTGDKAVFVGNNGTASANLQNPITTGGFASSRFPVASGTGDYPKLDTNYRGSINIYNGRCKYYEVYQTPDQGLPLELFFITRPKPTIVYEYQLSGFGGFGWRRNTNGALFQWAGQSSEYTRANDGTSFPKVGEINIMHFVMHSNKTMALRMSNSDGDLMFQDSLTIGSGTYFLRNQYIGSNGHPDNFDFYGYLVKFGELNTYQRQRATLWTKRIYPIGQKPNKPHCIPTLSISGSGASLTWTVNLNYDDGGTMSPIDLSASTVTLYYADQNAAYSGGNWLDFQGIIRTTDATSGNLSITRTLANTLTGGRYVIPGDNNTLLIAGVNCVSLAGQSHKEWPSMPIYNSLP